MIITLTTDFGLADGYVGAMKGVMLSIAPQARLVDISHQIDAGNIQQAAFVLSCAAPYFPQGTIHVAVVDPGVGSSRRAIAARTSQATFVAPDNGLLSLCLAGQAAEIRQLSNPRYHLPQVSATFHGRDIFAPVAAHLVAGAPFEEVGPLVTDMAALPTPAITRQADGAWRGQVVHVDRFGNLITNLSTCHLPSSPSPIIIEIAGRRIEGLARTYADGARDELLALIGSSGYLEIAVRDGNAAQLLDVQPGQKVLVRVNDE